MRPIRSLVIYFTMVFAGGALLAPWLYRLAQWGAGHWPALSGLAGQPFYRFVDRSLLGLALICLWPMLRCSGIRSWRDVGMGRQERILPSIFMGFALGWASLAVVALLALGFGAVVPGHPAGEVVRHLLNATWAAVVVAVLEELVFRGALFGLLRRAMPWPLALIVSSAVYAAVHFIQKAPTQMPVQWYSGLALLWQMICHPPALIPAFLTLFAAGAILALCYQRTGALYFSIGAHAGWIFWLKTYGFLIRPSAAVPYFWGGTKLIDGWLSFLILAILFVLIARRKRPQMESGTNQQ
jgi:membrane protease YdiL (CAAX protease family)